MAKEYVGESSSLSDEDDASSLEEFSDDNYDTDEEDSSFGFPRLMSIASPALETATALVSGGPDFLAKAMFPFQGPFIDSIVNDFLKARFGPSPGIRSLAGSDQTNSSTATGGASKAASSEAPANNSGRKRGRGDESPPERNPNESNQDGNGDDPNKRRKGNPNTKLSNAKKGKRYACPYYQREPNRFRETRSCLGPGWTEVHRVK